MLDWYLSLPRAGWKQRAFATLVAAGVLFNFYTEWGNLHASLAIARWIVRMAVAGVVLLLPPALVVLVGGRVPRAWSRLPGSLHKTLPQIHHDVVRERRERGQCTRRF